MRHTFLTAFVLVCALALPAVVAGHEGHTHKVLGTVAAVQANQVEVKSTDGKVIRIVLDAKTAVTRGKVKLDATALKVGERVSVDYTQQKSVNTAKSIKLAETAAPVKK